MRVSIPVRVSAQVSFEHPFIDAGEQAQETANRGDI
jgi:hypothetical protein